MCCLYCFASLRRVVAFGTAVWNCVFVKFCEGVSNFVKLCEDSTQRFRSGGLIYL